jgi:putative ABC transport system permease protein
LFSLVIALITVLVLFISALSSGLLGGFREYYEGLNADLLVYQDTARLEAASSRIAPSTRSAIRRVDGVQDAGPVAFSSASVVVDDGGELLDISLVGVEPGMPGEPLLLAGGGLVRKAGDEAIIDRNVAATAGIGPGDQLTISSVQEGEEKLYTLEVVGISESLKYSLNPSVFVPTITWDKIRPGSLPSAGGGELVYNAVAVRLEDPSQIETVRQRLQGQVDGIEAVDRTTAYESLAGYSSIRTSLTTQNTFALLIGMLVIGGFFQIQTLQKVPQIGMLKAIGTPNSVVAMAAMIQIMMVTLLGIAIGSAATLGLASALPPDIPLVFEANSGAMALGSIAVMGLIGGLVSVRYSLRVEPLIALGLSS